MQGGYKEYLRDLPISLSVPSVLVIQETKFRCTMNQVPLLCDNESAIKITYNPCEHS
jgi:hypothetical protein